MFGLMPWSIITRQLFLKDPDRENFWPANLHVIGKDILTPPHAVYWPIMLHASGLKTPQSILAHGWWTTSGAKMSKSTGETVDPLKFGRSIWCR